jgi:hypothetical protein
MTDIDAIRKTKRYAPRELCALGVESEERYTVATALDAALSAYDAKCEELNIARLQRDAKLCSECPRTGELASLLAERDAAVREREVLRKALNDYGTHGQYCASRRGTAVIGGETEWGPCTCGYEAALAPPTEQPKAEQGACPVLP